MGTRHNVVFLGPEYRYKDNNGNEQKMNKLKFNANGKINLTCIKNAPKVYVHWDGYPSGALPILKDFLNTDGAKHRLNDEQYLSAYYIAYKIIHDFDKTNLKELDDFASIGVEPKLNDWCDFTYIIQPETVDASYSKPVIYVLDYNYKLIQKIENINNLEKYIDEEWWY